MILRVGLVLISDSTSKNLGAASVLLFDEVSKHSVSIFLFPLSFGA